MQRDKTLQFWDDYHTENDTKEWIVLPTEDLFETIRSHFPKQIQSESSVQILEIGCGTSTMARDLWQHMQRREDESVHVCATDVSPICIQISRERDKSLLGEGIKKDDGQCSSTLEYQTLNVIDEQPSQLGWDIILDKGCLDTFLFRSRQRGENQAYANLIQNFLDKIWTWMAEDGVYLLISPRSKLRAVRDFAGFVSVKRHPLSSPKGALVGSTQNPGYIYVCRKNTSYEVGKTAPWTTNSKELPADSAECRHCGITFANLRNGEAVERRGCVFWSRQWKGHCIHCKSPDKSR